MKYFFTVLFLLLLPMASHAMADLSISQDDVSFSKDVLIAGDTVRIYATVRTVGDEDVSGFVTFYQGSEVIGQSQVISLLAGGTPDQVFIDFVVPSSDFNILTMIKGTDPADQNTSNDSTITERFQPIFDEDRDGVVDGEDNCVDVANASQTNTDGDGEGDVCDNDDDNDGVSDEVENEIGTNPLKTDSDGDGIDDADDPYPIGNDPVEEEVDSDEGSVVSDQNVEEVGSPDSATDVDSESVSALSKIVADLTTIAADDEEVEEDVAVESADVLASNLSVSPNAVFRYSRSSWNTFVFTVLEPEGEGRLYRWDFGDGITSSKREIEHAFATSGSYEVSLTIEDTSGNVSTERAVILVPFFTLQNRLVMTSVVLLSLLIILTIASLVVSGRNEHA